MGKKGKTLAEKKHMRKVAELNCIVCRKNGYEGTPAELHHISSGILSRKSDNFSVIPLCPYHHRNSDESYHRNPLYFSQKWGTQSELLKETLDLLQKETENES